MTSLRTHRSSQAGAIRLDFWQYGTMTKERAKEHRRRQGVYLRQQREKLGLTIRDAASATGVTRSVVSRLENGQNIRDIGVWMIYAAYLARAGADFGAKTDAIRRQAASKQEVVERAEVAEHLARLRDAPDSSDDPLLICAPTNVDIAVIAAPTNDRITAVGLSPNGSAAVGVHSTDRYGRSLLPAIMGTTVTALTARYRATGLRVWSVTHPAVTAQLLNWSQLQPTRTSRLVAAMVG